MACEGIVFSILLWKEGIVSVFFFCGACLAAGVWDGDGGREGRGREGRGREGRGREGRGMEGRGREGRVGEWERGKDVRSFQSRIQICGLFLKPLDLLFERLVLACLLSVLGHEEGDFLLEGADGFFGFVGFDVGL